MSGVKWGKTWRLYQKVTYHYQRSARLLSVRCTDYGLHRKKTAKGSPSAISCVPLMSQKSGCVRLGKRFQTPTPWSRIVSQTWTGFMPFMSRATRACTRSFPRNVLGTAICAILPSGGTSAAARFYARTVMRPSKWRSARMGRTTPCRQTNSSFRRSIGKTMSVPGVVPRCGRRSIRTGRPSESRLGNTAGYTAKIVSNWVDRWIVQHTVQLSEKCGLCVG